MCLRCMEEKKSVKQCFAPLSKRKRIWELEPSFHCSVVGTCLTLAELHHLCKKLNISLQKGMRDYDWHHSFVSVASRETYAAKYLSKYLDKKYKVTIKQVQNLDPEAMEMFWDEAIKQDQLPDVYWALLTHPLASLSLVDKMYGDVHMLSHLSGASVRIDMERLRRLEVEKKSFDKTIRNEVLEAKKKASQQAKVIQKLEQQLRHSEDLQAKLKIAESVIEQYKNSQSGIVMKNRLDDLEKKLSIKAKTLQKASNQAEEWQELAMKSGDQLGVIRSDHVQLKQEHEAMENMLSQLLNQQCANCDTEPECVNKDLDGNCILYVGGRDGMNAHFRALVENKNGEFIYHDGGLNDGRKRLGSLLPKADMVFCPKDCISHEAVNKLKKFCKRSGKPLIMLRRSSLAAFSKGLSEAVA